MSMPVTMELTAPAEAKELLRRLSSPREINEHAGRAVLQLIRGHFIKLDDERSKVTGFYRKAANSLSLQTTDDSATITINKPGIGLRRFGGEVNARSGGYLTIPAIAEAHGKPAGDFDNLRFAMFGGTAALIDKDTKKPWYWLVKSTQHNPDATVLPSEQEMQMVVESELDRYFKV